ncbi:MAG: hypothetical protein OSB19_02470 [Opitutaceae bacterium]|nr:hypothetical protein [Opitutaceae bacterium]
MKADLKGKELIRWKYQRHLKDYLHCIKSVDDSVGELRAYLKELEKSRKSYALPEIERQSLENVNLFYHSTEISKRQMKTN